MVKKKIFIATGGTGGHIIPAIALYANLKKRGYIVDIISDKRGQKFLNFFSKINPKIIDSKSLLKKNLFKFFYSLLILCKSFLLSFLYLLKKKPDLIFGMGGYSSIPICISAKIIGINFFIYENNLLAGKSNRLLSFFAKRILVSYRDVKGFKQKYSKKVSYVGNIIREKILNFKSQNRSSKKISVLILGGSQAAKIFAEKIPRIIKLCKSQKIDIKIFQQCLIDQNNYLRTFYKKNKINFKLFNFEKDILNYYKKANLVITRSGSSVIAELINCQIPFIAIPLESSADNHQLINASYFKKKGMCYLLREYEIDRKLFLLIKSFHKDKSLLPKIKNKQKKIINKKVYKNIENEINFYS